jgi:excisionase family DNA binding protein
MDANTIQVVPIAFSVGEVAELLGCSADTVRRMIGSASELGPTSPRRRRPGSA